MKSTFFRALALVIPVLFFSSCNQTPKGQSAEVGDAKEVAVIEKTAEVYDVDVAQSVVTWIGSKPTGQHNGTISLTEGTLGVIDGKISGGSFIIDIQSLENNDLEKGSEPYTKLTNHLMSDDFFAAKQFPTATFELVEVVPFDTSIAINSTKQFESDYTPATTSEFMVANPTHYITGNLTMRGITKSVKFPADIMININSIKAEAKFNINRTDWNLRYQDEASVADKTKDKFIYNTVNVGFSLSAVKAEGQDPT